MFMNARLLLKLLMGPEPRPRVAFGLLVGMLPISSCDSDPTMESEAIATDGSAAGSDAGERVEEGEALLLDDFTASDSAFFTREVAGQWFTYSDGTSQVEPPDHTGLGTTDGEVHVTGEGFTDWGAGLSAFVAGTGANLSAFVTLRVRASGTGTIVVEVVTPATAPPAEGGTCMGQGCFGHYATAIELGPEYEDFDLRFEDLTQPSWAQPAEFSLDRVIAINFLSRVTGGTANIDLRVDEVSLIRAPTSATER